MSEEANEAALDALGIDREELRQGVLTLLARQCRNRWDAFTDNELAELIGALDAWIDDPFQVNPEWEPTRALADEITTELQRRTGTIPPA